MTVKTHADKTIDSRLVILSPLAGAIFIWLMMILFN